MHEKYTTTKNSITIQSYSLWISFHKPISNILILINNDCHTKVIQFEKYLF